MVQARRASHSSGAAPKTAIDVRSPAFRHQSDIPRRFTEDGENISPPLEWSSVPSGTQELVLVMDDPDAPTPEPFAHWIVYHLPAAATDLPEGASRPGHHELPAGAAEGINSFNHVGYGGPAPPPGAPHRYRFNVYALDAPVTVRGKVDRATLLREIRDHTIGQGSLVGTYGRSKEGQAGAVPGKEP